MKKEGKPSLYLTFDDGPHPEITPWVLNELKHYNAKATFFCVGDNVRKFPEIFKMILEQGHQVGNHTFNHLNGWKNKNEDYFSNIDQCSEWMDSQLFRPPYGKITPGQTLHLRKKDFQIIMWSVLSRDFEADLKQSESLEAMIRDSEDGSIILFHDSEKAWKNLEVLLPAY
ncbi:MAG: polysaccharide deacetylase family protein, partial [Bacteroidota bacterium]|nr:polysaccharide deacetylase family protein [Bacteroidota bacterium]MDX5430811.1 polysaccharide deacetylase family protein [Bacteroidota bacterium]MDX5469557.1 polysaccharide deacetylase family protein [Bacteroidota bacterium]